MSGLTSHLARAAGWRAANPHGLTGGECARGVPDTGLKRASSITMFKADDGPVS